MKKLLSIYLSLFLLSSNALWAKKTLEVTFNDKTLKIDDDFKNSKIAPPWKIVKRVDPNSKKLLTYEGYYLKDFLSVIKKRFGIKSLHHMETMAIDGYRLVINARSLQSEGAFLALNIRDIPEKGIYNKILKSFFRWEPSYILLDPKSPKFSVASPYQVKKIRLFDRSVLNPILVKTDESYKKGAEVFIKTCSKCHRHLGYGGKKAPAIKFMIRRWRLKSDDALGAFLRNPQKLVKRKIQMSGYRGSESDLNELVKFLRALK